MSPKGTIEETFMCFGIEAIEAIVLIILFIVFIMAYYGPNAETVGGVKMDMWQHLSIQDINAFSKELLLVLWAEVSASIISGILL